MGIEHEARLLNPPGRYDSDVMVWRELPQHAASAGAPNTEAATPRASSSWVPELAIPGVVGSAAAAATTMGRSAVAAPIASGPYRNVTLAASPPEHPQEYSPQLPLQTLQLPRRSLLPPNPQQPLPQQQQQQIELVPVAAAARSAECMSGQSLPGYPADYNGYRGMPCSEPNNAASSRCLPGSESSCGPYPFGLDRHAAGLGADNPLWESSAQMASGVSYVSSAAAAAGAGAGAAADSWMGHDGRFVEDHKVRVNPTALARVPALRPPPPPPPSPFLPEIAVAPTPGFEPPRRPLLPQQQQQQQQQLGMHGGMPGGPPPPPPPPPPGSGQQSRQPWAPLPRYGQLGLLHHHHRAALPPTTLCNIPPRGLRSPDLQAASEDGGTEVDGERGGGGEEEEAAGDGTAGSVDGVHVHHGSRGGSGTIRTGLEKAMGARMIGPAADGRVKKDATRRGETREVKHKVAKDPVLGSGGKGGNVRPTVVSAKPAKALPPYRPWREAATVQATRSTAGMARELDGALPVTCNYIDGWFLLRHQLVACDCVGCVGPNENGKRVCWTLVGFEEHAGSAPPATHKIAVAAAIADAVERKGAPVAAVGTPHSKSPPAPGGEAAKRPRLDITATTGPRAEPLEAETATVDDDYSFTDDKAGRFEVGIVNPDVDVSGWEGLEPVVKRPDSVLCQPAWLQVCSLIAEKAQGSGGPPQLS
ncbi:hypothetical protein VOLCADRAFT_91053 [Volvox carteri f. nagariensis]|uniref:Uncharacterized protein n=1 Tax=Volvox carteri f. nagariensis TaxID=3068 RepID=D8TW22_VOLCA|nr:uncharacterized protein VOLCADRAFT_91053 [Volvox carteri f. nagariensis]EFJ48405.1 hypothetical protein VOLCADRAFT_91053 [Volvox carteri f. nagariensis]|eukprot:XP_002950659.1 hypothetical protein VOLCADRAFT_91053 [Volvox carteri f. nagariensis]